MAQKDERHSVHATTLALSAVVITAAFFCGGGSRTGFLGDVFIQLLAIPLLIVAVISWKSSAVHVELARQSGGALLLAALLAFVAVLFVQLVPLPVSWFANRFPAVFVESGGALPAWTRLSLTPASTWTAAVSTIPIFAVFAGVSQLDAPARSKLAALVIGLGTVALLVGFLQVVQGPQSGLRFYEFTNPSEAVGFFANRNHYAAQLYTVLVFAAVWFTLQAQDLMRPGAYNTRAFLWFAAAAGLLLATIAGLAMARSRAGVFLAMAATAGIVAIVYTGGNIGVRNRDAAMREAAHGRNTALWALGFAVLFAVLFGLQRVMTRFEADPLDDLRTALTPMTLRLAVENLPFGSGLGSFVPVYATSERTEDLFGGYANRAHNDWAEFLLETGVFGVVIAVLFLSWVAMRTVAVWRGWSTGDLNRHLMLQRAATLAIGLLLAHSLVDYPLRTTAMATLFAFACALLIEPPQPLPIPHAAERMPYRRRSRRRRTATQGSSAFSSAPRTNTIEVSAVDDKHDWSSAWQQGEQRALEKEVGD